MLNKITASKKHLFIITILAGLLWLASVERSHAYSYQLQYSNFAITNNGGLTFVINPFDTSLGTLDSVVFTIDGWIQTFGPPPQNLTEYYIDAFGFGGQFFKFSGPASVMVENYLGNTSSPVSAQAYFKVRFDQTSDLIGTGIPVASTIMPPAFISGMTSNFFAMPGYMDMFNMLFYGSYGAEFYGTCTTEYFYTSVLPAPIANTLDTTSSVPEPSTMLLLGSGLAGLVFASRRRVKR